jgi:hypothetical protein
MFINSKLTSNFIFTLIISMSVKSFADDSCHFLVVIKEGYDIQPIALYKQDKLYGIDTKDEVSGVENVLELRSNAIYDSSVKTFQELDADSFDIEVELHNKSSIGNCSKNISIIELEAQESSEFIDWVVSQERLIKYSFNEQLELVTNFSLLSVTDLNMDSKLEFWVVYSGMYGYKMYALFEEIYPNEYKLVSRYCRGCN